MAQVFPKQNRTASDGETVGSRVLRSTADHDASIGLGPTLRMWRDRLHPAHAGVRSGWPRRAVGLRREELAELAGISVDYVIRLEQGRATAPSASVVAALARALRLDRSERNHLYCLAGLQPPADRRLNDRLSPSVLRVLGRLDESAVAAFAADWQLLWWNSAWAALLGDPSDTVAELRNLVVVRFPTPSRSGQLHAWPVRSSDYDATDRAIVADLRHATARYPEDPRLADLLRVTIDENARFASLWRSGAVGEHSEDRKTIEHPLVGDITVDCDVLSAADGDIKIVVMSSPPGSDDAFKIERVRVAGSATVSPAEPYRRIEQHDKGGCGFG